MNVIVSCRLWKLNSRTSPLAPYLGLSVSWSFWKGASDSAPSVFLLAEPHLYASLAPAWLSRRWRTGCQLWALQEEAGGKEEGTARKVEFGRMESHPLRWSSVASRKWQNHTVSGRRPLESSCWIMWHCGLFSANLLLVHSMKDNEKSPFLERCCYTQDTRQRVVRY